MKILVTIPHFYRFIEGSIHISMASKDPMPRVKALARTIMNLQQHLGLSQYYINHVDKCSSPANISCRHTIDIVVCTNGVDHVLNELPLNTAYYSHHPITIDDPRFLGFECRTVFKEHIGEYDYFCFLEDDIAVRDPYFFHKIDRFTDAVHPLAVLMPNRYEVAVNLPADKCYIDGLNQIPSGQCYLTAQVLGLDTHFVTPTFPPHSGCYFLNSDQMEYWMECDDFEGRDACYISPLESAATLGLMKNFRVYKPAWENAAFLEVEHYDDAYLSLTSTILPPTQNSSVDTVKEIGRICL